VLTMVLCAAGCNGAKGAASGADNPRAARLCEDEMYRMGEQMKVLQKQLDEEKAAAAAATKAKADTEQGSTQTAEFLMDQLKDKDAQIHKLQERVAELEKGQAAPASTKP